MKINSLKQFEEFLKTRIPSREALFVGDIGLKRAKYFMKKLGNPQNKLKVIHIAGTSGKGSTANLTSHILASQGFMVGLSISPHVFDVRERFQINNALPEEKLIMKYFNQILPAIKEMEKCKYGMPTYFETLVGLAYFMFADLKMDYAVMETGLGGKLDATNTVGKKNKLCLLTKIGLDHTEILGKTIGKIADDKSKIIHWKNTTISAQQSNSAGKMIKKQCDEKHAALCVIKTKTNYSTISSTPKETIFDFDFDEFKLEKIRLGLLGIHQAENCSIALACLATLSKRDRFKINETSLRTALKKITIPGRLEIKKIANKTMIIDGAHNPQKMQALTSNIAKLFPKQKFTFIVAFKHGKDYQKMLKKIIPLADKIYLSRFSTSNMDNHWSSIDNHEISLFLKSQNFKKFEIIKNNKSDILEIIKKRKKSVIITGSLYFIGKIYSHAHIR